MSCALAVAGTAQCWGSRKDLDSEFPKVAVTIQTTMYPPTDSVCLLVGDGRIGCWGAVAYLSGSVSALRAEEIAVGNAHLCGVGRDGRVFCVSGGTSAAISPPPELLVLR